jgi:hypothetical protein
MEADLDPVANIYLVVDAEQIVQHQDVRQHPGYGLEASIPSHQLEGFSVVGSALVQPGQAAHLPVWMQFLSSQAASHPRLEAGEGLQGEVTRLWLGDVAIEAEVADLRVTTMIKANLGIDESFEAPESGGARASIVVPCKEEGVHPLTETVANPLLRNVEFVLATMLESASQQTTDCFRKHRVAENWMRDQRVRRFEIKQRRQFRLEGGDTGIDQEVEDGQVGELIVCGIRFVPALLIPPPQLPAFLDEGLVTLDLLADRILQRFPPPGFWG